MTLTFETPETVDGARFREFTLTGSESGRDVTGVLWDSDQTEAGRPMVCFGHGASGHRHQAPIPRLAARLAREFGFFGLSLDGPVPGRRETGGGGRKAFWPEWRRPGTVRDMLADWRTAIDAVQARPEVGQGPLGYWGLSMGTIYGAPLVAAESRIEAAVLGLMGVVEEPEHYRAALLDAADSITCPVLFIWQLEDELFSRAQCLALFDAIASSDKRLHANPGLHPHVPAEELEHSVRFLADVLLKRPRDQGVLFNVSE